MSDNFLIEDQVQHVYREEYYGKRSAIRQVARKLRKLRMYFFLMTVCAGFGAAATFIGTKPPRPPAPAFDLSEFKNLENISAEKKAALLKQAGSGDAMQLYERYKDKMGSVKQ